MSTRCTFASISPGMMNLPRASMMRVPLGIRAAPLGVTAAIRRPSMSTVASASAGAPVAEITVPPTSAMRCVLGDCACTVDWGCTACIATTRIVARNAWFRMRAVWGILGIGRTMGIGLRRAPGPTHPKCFSIAVDIRFVILATQLSAGPVGRRKCQCSASVSSHDG